MHGIILWIGRDEVQRERLGTLLRKSGFVLWAVDTPDACIQRLRCEGAVDAVWISGESALSEGLDLLDGFRDSWPSLARIWIDSEPNHKEQADLLEKVLEKGIVEWHIPWPLEQKELRLVLAWLRRRTRRIPISGEFFQSMEASDTVLEFSRALGKRIRERTSQLELAKREWEQTFDAIQDPLLIIGQDYSVQRANLALAEVFQLDIREVIGLPCYQVLLERSSPCEACPLKKTISKQKGQRVEIRHKDQEKLYQLHSFPLSGEPSRVVHEYRDITEEKVLQQKLFQGDKLAAIGMLAGRVAHEINNPLAIILAQAQLSLLKAKSEGKEKETSLLEIEKAALRCRKIVQDLLEFSRQEPANRNSWHNLNDIVHKALRFYLSLTANRSSRFSLDLMPSLPNLRVDPQKIQSVVLNLLSNAKAAVAEDGKIWLSTKLKNNEVILCVGDNGGGVPVAIQDKIFMPFFTTKPKELGAGLGLYIVQEIVTEHEGQILFKSEEGVGTELCIHLPLR